jgi:hypothetical protein
MGVSLSPEFQKAYILDPEQPNIRKEYAQALVGSWPSLIMSREGPLPKTWSDVWGFYVNLWIPDFWSGGTPIEQCTGQLEVGNGRIKYSCPRAKWGFDGALGDVKDARIQDGYVLIILGSAKKTKTFEFEATDRMGHTEPAESLLDAVFQAMGK